MVDGRCKPLTQTTSRVSVYHKIKTISESGPKPKTLDFIRLVAELQGCATGAFSEIRHSSFDEALDLIVSRNTSVKRLLPLKGPRVSFSIFFSI